jgi:hypothetical protein
MCLGTNWVFISQKTTFFIVTAVKTFNLTKTNKIAMKSQRICKLLWRESKTDFKWKEIEPEGDKLHSTPVPSMLTFI